ncbi:dual specificity protein phosphatase 22-like [Ischnura elegans]|uniref:dual specificity protein phosphatase 22-like n=1 Tax=Ischnura elegans TaxID=197161 RepID=UPI001ED87A75|nr:dual specificity protein phosphatase 22-like [Ischnura elegans]
MGNGMNKVLPGLYVGNYRDSKDAAQLDRYEITHIVAIHDAARRLHPDKHYLCVLASDSPEQNLSQFFPLCNDFIHAARLRGGNVLIHCLAGMSRSVTVAVAYIMSVTSLNWKEALKVVRVGRAVANPNLGFLKQLHEFEESRLADERRRLKERYPSVALVDSDEEQCQLLLVSYQSLILSRDICDGQCAYGQVCPTGLCRVSSKSRIFRRKGSQKGTSPPTSGRSSPRVLPPTPPARLRSCPSSASLPASLLADDSPGPHRSASRLSMLSDAGAGARPRTTPLMPHAASTWRVRERAGSAPVSPRASPPATPRHSWRLKKS